MMATDWRELQKQAHARFAAHLTHVEDWSGPTPDTDWDVRQLVSHVIEEQQWVPLLLAGRSVGEARSRIDPLDADLISEWERYSTAATRAWEEIDLRADVQLSSDTVPAGDYLREQVSDVIVHTWDLARSIGADERLDDVLVEAAWTIFEPQKDTLEASGLFASVIPIDEDAPLQSKLLALTGRDDRIAA
jgi:uncharacterized protein (TIGR03086 family)